MTGTTADLWHHYGRSRADHERAVPDSFRWAWSQRGGPGPELLQDLAGRTAADLGAGAARHAAYLAVHHRPARIDAIDASPAQHAMATGRYAHLAPQLRIVHADVVEHLRARPSSYDVLYSVFGAVCFTDPYVLLPTAVSALRPGGRLVFSTLGHYLNGTPARTDVAHADIPAKTPEGDATTMRRWVLQGHVWAKALEEAGFVDVGVDTVPAAERGPRTADTLVVTASRRRA
ncbi:class I SAM-dependent methyltransferase [Streptomyces sp. Z26]|uniref:class I SAM-dependent methyltransferase n=1 Tax=Streptomyces sp. Z26 TaxID=2500177 RepID=UPI001F0BBB8A|nr:class I SAM-dependent methyltransferase [Streptomyces sp. Z26]